jgi:hypothetical protein
MVLMGRTVFAQCAIDVLQRNEHEDPLLHQPSDLELLALDRWLIEDCGVLVPEQLWVDVVTIADVYDAYIRHAALEGLRE